MFIGRIDELKYFTELYNKNTFQFMILYGRRRVGKTTFLREFTRKKLAIYFSAEQTTDKDNLDKFSAIIFSYYQEKHLENFTTWDKAISYINEKQQNKRLILIIDEFPYLAIANPRIMSAFQHLVDHTLEKGKMFIVFCGSYVSFMENKVLGEQSPLFGRRTGQLKMQPFDYYESSSFMGNFSVKDKLLAYCIYGGIPMYLRQIDTKQLLEENVKQSFFNPIGYLYEEPLLLLKQELHEPAVYFALIEAIAFGHTRSNDIAMKVGLPVAQCVKYMAVLRELGVLIRELPFGSKSRARHYNYKIVDPMFCFWFRFVAANKSVLESNGANIMWEKLVVPDLSNYMGHMFERVCQEYLLRKNSSGKLPFFCTKIGRWWGSDKMTKKAIEIDLIASDGDKYIFGECKWRNAPLGYGILEELKFKANVYSNKSTESYYILFSKSGFSPKLKEKAKADKHIILVDADTMLL